VGTTTYSAIAPSLQNDGVETPNVWRLSHRFVRPARQRGQSPHQRIESNVTRVPRTRASAPGPTASITPDASWPMITGGMRRPVVPV